MNNVQPSNMLAISWAYEFFFDEPLSEIERRLNQFGPWQWQARDSSWYGDYLNCRPLDGLRVRIHDLNDPNGKGPKYNALLTIDRDKIARKAEVDATFRQLMAKLPSRNLIDAEVYD